MDILSECSLAGCEGEEVGESGYCAPHIEQFAQEGWKYNLKSRTWRRNGVRITRTGAVSVTLSYNPRLVSLMAGEISVEELDEEELARGMCRNPDGSFPRKAPEMVPKVLHDRMVRELFARADEALRLNLLEAVNSVTKIATGESVDPNVKLKAATWMFERLRGKVPDVVHVTQERPYQATLEKLHRGDRPVRKQLPAGDASDDVIDAEVVSGDAEPEPEPMGTEETLSRVRKGLARRDAERRAAKGAVPADEPEAQPGAGTLKRGRRSARRPGPVE